MHVAAGMDPHLPLSAVADHARRVERLGFDALHVAEMVNDAFVVSALALEHTERLVVRTSLAVAFARSPMQVALTSWSLARLGPGRFDLGLGTQIKANVAERFGVTWTDPVEHMADYVAAVRACFAAFAGDAPLHHEGPRYRLTRLQPEFNPGPLDGPAPPIWLGGVGDRSCRLGGELADGFVTHPTNSDRRYLTEACLPALEEGRRAGGRGPGAPLVVAGGMVATGPDDAAVAQSREERRRRLGFLFSTPAYRRTLELHGWTDLGDVLRSLARAGRWDDMAAAVEDEVLDTVVVSAPYGRLASAVAERYADIVDGVLLQVPDDPAHDDAFTEAVEALRAC
ncbi:MAG: TIGR03617 family F420-dependent LLM class oxidoreductase [Acidimicrobiales bacterium]|nr:TIGR03617 family F420-dependent LLM class oxidoreductase [Acidimicrobiales bacterium]